MNKKKVTKRQEEITLMLDLLFRLPVKDDIFIYPDIFQIALPYAAIGNGGGAFYYNIICLVQVMNRFFIVP